MHWYDNAVKQIEKALDQGHLTDEEFEREMSELNEELEQAKQEAAQSAYDNFYQKKKESDNADRNNTGIAP